MFNFSEESNKLKAQALTLSGVSLFIALTGALPDKIAIIGLDLTSKKEITGWFLFYIASYFIAKFFILSCLEVLKEYLPNIISHKTRNTRGDTLGLTQREIHENQERYAYSQEDDNTGNIHGEESDIFRKNELILNKVNSKYVIIYNSWVYLSDLVIPFAASILCLCALYTFLMTGAAVKIT